MSSPASSLTQGSLRSPLGTIRVQERAQKVSFSLKRGEEEAVACWAAEV